MITGLILVTTELKFAHIFYWKIALHLHKFMLIYKLGRIAPVFSGTWKVDYVIYIQLAQ